MRINNHNNLTFGSLYTNIGNKEIKKTIEQSPILQEFAKDCDIHITAYKRRKKSSSESVLEYGLKYRVKECNPTLISKEANKYINYTSKYTLPLNDIQCHINISEYRKSIITDTLINEIKNLTIDKLNQLKQTNILLKKIIH